MIYNALNEGSNCFHKLKFVSKFENKIPEMKLKIDFRPWDGTVIWRISGNPCPGGCKFQWW
jgi:hypothetical protein